MLNTGAVAVESRSRLLTTLAYRLDGRPTYALEGSIFVAGGAVKWLRDRLGVIARAEETEAHARAVASTGGAYLVPAFAGLGTPYWDAGARGALVGLTLDSGVAEITRAALESVAYQSRDLVRAMDADLAAAGRGPVAGLRVDGGMVVNDWLMGFLADMLGIPVERPRVAETTALGAAYLAGLAVGLYASTAEIAALWGRDRRFESAMVDAERDRLYAGWQAAVARVRSSR